MILIISGRPENVASFDMIADHTVEQHVGWKLVGAVRVVTELGGVFHALVVDLGGARTALFWDRGSVRFAIAPLWGSKGDQMHNVVCSCSECQVARATLRPGEVAKGLDGDLEEMMTNRTDPSAADADPPSAADAIEQIAGLQLQIASLDDRVKQLEQVMGRALARLGQLETR